MRPAELVAAVQIDTSPEASGAIVPLVHGPQPDGSTIAFGGFAMPGVPFNLIKALMEQGAKRLTLVANTTGGAQQPRMPDIGMLVENGQVVVRPMNYLALSYDHRIIDGREAVLSLVARKDALEDPARLLLDI